MQYADLVRLYFERSSALQMYWTVYVVVIGGLLAFSSLRQVPDKVTGILVTVLFCFFAYKNMGAIGDVTAQREAAMMAVKEYGSNGVEISRASRDKIEATMISPEWEGTRNFHIASDVITVLALWGMELRRMRRAKAVVVV